MRKFKKDWRKKILVSLVFATIISSSIFVFGNFGTPRLLTIEDISAEFVEERLELMRDWFLVNERKGNTLPYLYYPEKDEYKNDNNIIRQLLTTQGIFALAKHRNGDHELFTVGENNLKAIFRKYYKFEKETGFGFFEGSNKSIKLGGAALGVVAILEGGLSEKYPDELIALAKLVEAMQQPNGSFQTFYRPENFISNDRFYSGEALLAATRLYEFSGDAKWLEFVERSFDFYSEKLRNNFLPQYVPWHTMAYAEMFEATGEQKYADFIFWMNDRLIDEMLVTDSDNPKEIGRFYSKMKSNSYGPPHSASTSVYIEGVGYAQAVAEKTGDQKRASKYSEAVILGTRSLLELQFTVKDANAFSRPEKVIGAIGRTFDRSEIRIDQTGHSANGILEAIKILNKN